MSSSNLSKFFFIRHGQLIRPYDDHLTMNYQTLADLSTSTLDPGIRENSFELFRRQTSEIDFSGVSKIYYNNSGSQTQRSIESASLIADELERHFHKDLLPEGLPELHEIRFDVKKMLTENQFSQGQMPAIRTALYKSIVKGGTSESATKLKNRVETISQVVQTHKQKGELVIFVTHDFFMRIIEVFIKKLDRLDHLTVPDLENTSLNYYFGGFSTDADFKTFQRWGKKVT